MSRFKWYRRWKGGYWVRYHFTWWTQISSHIWSVQGFSRRTSEAWEDYTND